MMNLTISKAKLSSALAPLALGAGIAFMPINYGETISNITNGDMTIATSDVLAARGGSGGTDGSCCGGDNGGGTPGGNDHGGGDGNDNRYCEGIIEAAGTVNGHRAYRFSENRGNNQQNSSDGVFTSNRTYRIGETVRLNESHTSSLLNNIVWTTSPVRDGAECRRQLGEYWGEHQGYIGQGIPFVANGQTVSGDVSTRTTVTGGSSVAVVATTPAPTAFYVTTLVNGGNLCAGVAANNDRLQSSYSRLSDPQHIRGYMDGRFTEGEVAAINSCDAIGLTKSFQTSCVFELDNVEGQRAFLRNGTCPANNFAAAATVQETTIPAQDVTVTYSSVVVGNCVETTKSVGGVAESFTRSCAPVQTATAEQCVSLMQSTPASREAICRPN